MNKARTLCLALCLTLVLGCSAGPRPSQPPVAQPTRQTAFSPSEFADTLTADQIRKANTEGLPFSELTPQQQQAVSSLWAEHAAQVGKHRPPGATVTPVPAGPVEEAKIVMAGYAELPEGNQLALEFRRGNSRLVPLASVKEVPTAFKDAGKDLVAGGMCEPVTGETGTSSSEQYPLGPEGGTTATRRTLP